MILFTRLCICKGDNVHNKIRKLRISVNLTETEISNLLNISSYKYRRYESGEINITSETVVLLSIIFQVPLDFFLYDKYSIEDVINKSFVKRLDIREHEDIITNLEQNLCRACPYECTKISYRVIKRVIQKKQNIFSENIKNIRCEKLLEIEDVSKALRIPKELYLNIEKSQCFPDISLLVELANYLSVPIDSLFRS